MKKELGIVPPMRDGKAEGWAVTPIKKKNFNIKISPAHCRRKGYFFSEEKKQNSFFVAQVLWAQSQPASENQVR